MSVVIVTSTATYIKSVPDASDKEVLAVYKKLSTLETVALHDGRKGTYVELKFSDSHTWDFDMNNKRGSEVTVNGVSPIDNDNLAELLAALII